MADEKGLFGSSAPTPLSPEDIEKKRAIYEAMSPRGRRFVDKMGYDAWDPFQEPKEPTDIRKDVSKRTTQELVRRFLQEKGGEEGSTYRQGALECALGLVNKEEKYRGAFEFCLWYNALLKKEGYLE